MDSWSSQAAPAVEGQGRFRRVLAASLLDAPGAAAVVRAALLPLAAGARVVVLHVAPPWSFSRSRRSPDEARRSLHGIAEEARAAAALAAGAGVELVPRIVEGWPSLEIVRAAWQERAELVVVGPPAVRLDGSARRTIPRIVRRADLPVIVARRDPAREYRRVLCAVDRSVTAVDTILLGARLAAPGARVTLFHAVHLPFEPWSRSGAPELEDEGVAHVAALARAVAEEVAIARVLVRPGDRCTELLRALSDERPDVVVVGTHGRAGISRAVLGSYAEWVMANAPVDVVVARPHRIALERR
jgi:nucleotide-binding universal stress UspA family protein